MTFCGMWTGLLAASDGAECVKPTLDLSPGPEYADSVRMFQGIPGIERSPGGRLWATWYGGGVGEGKDNFVMLTTSSDDGRTWSPLTMVIDPDRGGPYRAYDPCLWHDPQGRLWLFWGQRRRGTSTQCWATVTKDSNSATPTWSPPRRIAKGVMMNKPTVLSNGSWLLPIANWRQAGSSGVVVSKDNGSTFHVLGGATIPNPKDRNCDEHMIVQRKNGDLWMLVRTLYGIGQSISADQGRTWSDIRRSAIPHTVSRFLIRRLASGKLLLVIHSGFAQWGGRSHLTAFLSNDDGTTWQGGLLLDERNWVSYPDGVEGPDGTIHLIYDYSRTGEKDILMAVFTEQDVLNKKPGENTRLRVLVNHASGTIPPKGK